jgi:hypothetical protein
MLCIPLGTTFKLLPGFFLSALDGACSDFTFYILLGDFALVELNKKRKITSYGPIKKPFSPFGKEKGAIGKMKKGYIKLHIISSKLIRIPRSRNVVAVHIFQSVRTWP